MSKEPAGNGRQLRIHILRYNPQDAAVPAFVEVAA